MENKKSSDQEITTENINNKIVSFLSEHLDSFILIGFHIDGDSVIEYKFNGVKDVYALENVIGRIANKEIEIFKNTTQLEMLEE